MAENRPVGGRRSESDRLLDEVEQLRTALEASEEEITRLVDDRDHLLGRVTAQARDLQAVNEAHKRSRAAEVGEPGEPSFESLAIASEQKKLRVALEEMQVLTETLEVSNNSLQESNRVLDQRVAECTRELGEKNAALESSELRFRTLVEGMPQLVWRAVDGGKWTWTSPQWTAYTGLSADDSQSLGWLDAVHPDDRDAALAAWKRAEAGAPLEFEARIFQRTERRHRHFKMRATPAQTHPGDAPEWLGTSTDVDDLARLQQRQRILVAQLQHRVRNILTVVRSVFNRTMEAGGDSKELADHFVGRLDSLARSQVVVTRNATGLVDLENLIRDELLSVGCNDDRGLIVDGPDVSLPANAAESIGLAIHELTTNALKYGALKVPSGRLEIRWTVDKGNKVERLLTLVWSEHGVPAISLEPARQGFGTELITKALPYRLGAKTELEFRPLGVRCAIMMPLPSEEDFEPSEWKM